MLLLLSFRGRGGQEPVPLVPALYALFIGGFCCGSKLVPRPVPLPGVRKNKALVS